MTDPARIEQDRIPCTQVLGAYTVRFQRQD